MLRALTCFLLSGPLAAYYEDDCFRETEFYGGVTSVENIPAASPDFVVKSDLEKLRALDHPLHFRVSAIVSCIKEGRLLSQRLGVSDNSHASVSQHAYWTTTWLNTMGPGSASADFCDEFYTSYDAHLHALKLYFQPGVGITGAVYEFSDGSTKSVGDTSTQAQAYTFPETEQLLGYEAVTYQARLVSLRLLSVVTDPKKCAGQSGASSESEIAIAPQVLRMEADTHGTVLVVSVGVTLVVIGVSLTLLVSLAAITLMLATCVVRLYLSSRKTLTQAKPARTNQHREHTGWVALNRESEALAKKVKNRV